MILKAVHPDPVKRYTSALEMRRALEKLNYPGHWTVDAAGNEVGKYGTYAFSHSAVPVGGAKFDVICSKPTPDRLKGLRGTNQDIYDTLVLGTTIAEVVREN